MLVIDNLMDKFASEVTIAECRAFYTLQAYVETIHSETYATALEKFSPPERRAQLFDALQQEPTIQAKGAFAQKYMDQTRPFEERLWAFCMRPRSNTIRTGLKLALPPDPNQSQTEGLGRLPVPLSLHAALRLRLVRLQNW